MLRLRTRFTLVMTSVVLFVVAVLSCVFATQLLEQLISETVTRAADLAEQVYLQANYALVEGQQRGLHPDSDIHDYARHAFEISEGLQTQVVAAGKNPLVYEVSITDTDGLVLASTEENLPGKLLAHRTSLSQLVSRSLLYQLKVLSVPTRRTVRNPHLFEHDYAFSNDTKPFGEVRVIVDSALLVQEIKVGLRIGGILVLVALVVFPLLAAMVSRITLMRTAESSSAIPNR